MTGLQIYKTASSMLYEKDGEDKDSKTFSVDFLNVLLQEALPTENSIRRAYGRAELAEAPYLETLDTEIPYDASITRIALPYGVSQFFFQEAMNNFQAENYRAKYIAALEDAKKCSFETITDAYAEE